MAGLHRILHNRDQVLAQLIQVDLIAQCGTERLHGLGCIILATVEATVDDSLDATSQGLEERCNHQR